MAEEIEGNEELPLLPRILDNMWLLLIVSTLILAVSYVGWGLLDAMNVPQR